MEIFEESMPFVYDIETDTLVYKTDFAQVLNPWATRPGLEDWVDTLKIAKVTTWTPQKDPFPFVEEDTPYDQALMEEMPDRIDLLVPIEVIKGDTIYIGVYNSRPEDGPVSFTIRMREFS